MAAETPTFKLVLVGDGGTGKVSALQPRYLVCDGHGLRVAAVCSALGDGQLVILMNTLSCPFVAILCPRACQQY